MLTVDLLSCIYYVLIMTKRNHRFEENNNKKPKLDNDIDALWGDDLDETVLDVLATQVEVTS